MINIQKGKHTKDETIILCGNPLSIVEKGENHGWSRETSTSRYYTNSQKLQDKYLEFSELPLEVLSSCVVCERPSSLKEREEPLL